ncbi:class I fructose-bisphosphate aldolase [Nocardia camponoti]|uniref:fructose-bisphosphate aldolase n=1 Tax=Nocardia camponoti TaxID=1616106 RepID=A0A917QBU9_9NOCA|nr:class I fructose-bisphosphate aldolase [Nocardia camponoti]GGK42375.1 fructose-bisphosphate aldolase [Nocardia camponoti]
MTALPAAPPLANTAATLTATGRGILAADESIATMSARLSAEGVTPSATSRRDYRELLLTAPALAEFVSGIILCEETFRQSLADGTPFPVAARALGVLPGIKVDAGTSVLPGQNGALITEGLDGLGKRLASFAAAGAAFAKWRAVIDVSTTSRYSIDANAAALARYAALCVEHGIVPIVEPEVLSVGDHSLAASEKATRRALAALFSALDEASVEVSAVVLKPNFITPGLAAPPADARLVADVTYSALRDHVPASVGGIAFLSGGHPTERVCAYLRELSAVTQRPWPVTFSFGRALVSAALRTWAGEVSLVADAQAVLVANCRAAALSVAKPQGDLGGE